MLLLSLLLVALLATRAASAAVVQSFTDNVDYIIVGGGPAGFVLAEQLSRDPNAQVILLEAGPDGINSSLINTPAYYPEIQQYFFNYSSQPDSNLGGNAPGLTQGRVYGGGTAVNGQAYCRGAASVFDEWAETSGNAGLAWTSILEDFKATSHYTFQPADYSQFVDTSVFGTGPIEVSRTSGETGFDQPFAKAIGSGFNLNEIDMSDGTGIGLDLGLASIRVSNRTRSYARNSFGFQIESRPNVQLIDNALVHNIGFSGKVAKNITYVSSLSNENFTLAAKEIIVSGGAINTPKLLMLSGVGPALQLQQLDISVVADIPSVGQNLRDHLFPIIELEVTPNITTVWQWLDNATESAIAQAEYVTNSSGPLGWDNGLAYAAFRVPDSVFDGINGSFYTNQPEDRPHVLVEYSTVPFDSQTPNRSVVTIWPALVQPESTGHVSLQSKDYRADPLIYSNYFGSPADKRAIIWAYKTLRDVLSSSPDISSVIVEEFYPGNNVSNSDDNALWKAIQGQAFSFHHPMGTVALGKAVNGSDWRVVGLEGLRVVDISTFPNPPTCHPQADVYALAHRAARDIVDADQGQRGRQSVRSHAKIFS